MCNDQIGTHHLFKNTLLTSIASMYGLQCDASIWPAMGTGQISVINHHSPFLAITLQLESRNCFALLVEMVLLGVVN